jgi:hypothetical protein
MEKIEKCEDCISEGKQCRLCWEFENHPETFTLTKEQDEEMNITSQFIQKCGMSANVDSPC